MEPIEGVIGAIFKGAVTHNDGFDTGDDKDWVNRPLLLVEEDKDDAFHYDDGGLVIDILEETTVSPDWVSPAVI